MTTTPKKVNTTAVRTPTEDPENHTMVLRQLKETIEVAQRLRGNANDSFVRLGELVRAGVVRLVGGTVQAPDTKAPPGNAAPSSRQVLTIDSLSGGGDLSADRTLQLVGDVVTPGNSMLYGTNGSGTRGWYTQPAGGSSPLTTKGDLFGRSTADARVPVGTNGQVLTADSTQTLGVKWAAATPVVSDLLLHFNGSNGGTSTTDSGSHAFTVTRIGSATLENTQVKFGTTATQGTFTDGWSVPDDASLRFGANDFSIDFWIYPTNWVGGSNQENAMLTKWGVGTTEWYITNNSSNGPAFYYNGTFPTFGLTQAAIPLNTWTHVQVTRTGNFIKLYLNGALSGSPINIASSIITGTTAVVKVAAAGTSGQAFYIDEVRIVNYRGNFTAPTAEYTG